MVSLQGIFYSGTAIILVTLMAVHIISYVDAVRTEGAHAALRMRTSELSNLLESAELDMPRVVEISSKRALVSAVNEVDLRGAGLDDATVRMRELMLNGTIYGAPAIWMNESHIPAWTARVASLVSKRGFLVNITLEELTVEPYDSFRLISRLRWNITASDSVGSIRVARNLTTEVLVPLEGVEDPLYLLGSRGLAHRNVYAATFLVHNRSTLDDAISSGYYMNSSEAPSFLDRLENNLIVPSKYNDMTPAQIGLETFVSLPELYSAGVDVRPNQTMIDHLYFGETNITGFRVNGSVHDWFRLEQTHADKYGVGDLLLPG